MRARDTIRYCGDAAFAPFEYLDPQGIPRGFQIDLLAELGRTIDADFQVSLQPWERAEADFRARRCDVVAMVDTPNRRVEVAFTRGYATPAFAIYRTQDRAEPQSLQDISGLRIAVLDGDAMRDTLRTWLSGLAATFVPVVDARQALGAIRRGLADVALLPHAYGDPALAALADPGIVAGSLSFVLQSYALAVAKDNDALRQRLQRGLEALERAGRLEALRARWLSSHKDVAERHRLLEVLQRQQALTWGIGAAAAVALVLVGRTALHRGRHLVAERKRRRGAGRALERAKGLLETAFLRNPEPMLIVERGEAIVRDANGALAALLGIPGERLIGQTLHGLAHHLDAEALAQLVSSLDRSGRLDAVPLRLTRADGRARDCLVSAEPLAISGVAQVFCIVRDVTEQLEQDAVLRTAYDELVAELAATRSQLADAQEDRVRAEDALDAYTRSVTHDLRAPLNAMHGYVGLLQRRLRDGHVEEALDCSERIGAATQRMNSMITALSRLVQVARQSLQREVVDMAQLARDEWNLLLDAHAGRRVTCRFDQLPEARADPDLAAQVWQNLLDNALKYSAKVEEAKVSVDSFREDRRVWYRVTDNGAGFDMASATSLFQPFQRMHAASQFAGTGIGLSVVRRIVDHHQGDIRIRSTRGIGTIVEFTLEPVPKPI